jgi:hypothetical protein
MNQETAISSGDIRRSSWPQAGDEPLFLYQGSGRAGACWGPWGLMDRDGDRPTGWMHADHWHRGHYGLDAWLFVARLTWANEAPPPPREYEQILTLRDGRLTTRAAGDWGRLAFSSYFDPGRPDVLAFEIDFDCENELPPLLVEPCLQQEKGYSGPLRGSARSLETSPAWNLLEIEIGSARTLVGVRIVSMEGEASCVADNSGLRLAFQGRRGRHLLLIGTAAAARKADLIDSLQGADARAWANEARENWKKRWGSAWIFLPDAAHQALWARSHFYLLCSYGADVRSPAPPLGWTGGAWPYSFPQDLSYIHPALLRLGHLDIAKAWIEFYHRTIPSMREATRRIYGAEGVMWAWEYPIGEQSRILADGSPNQYQFEIHNAAYPARMAWETARYLGDAVWAREVAWEVVRESARFFASSLRRADDGLWDLRVTPSMGQDELDLGTGQNYLCSLFSAEYSLKTGADFAALLGIENDEVARWRAILADGLAFPRLLHEKLGLYSTREGVDVAALLGQQKHPVQLNPLIFLPMGRLTPATLAAYRLRDELCTGVRDGRYQGWTLAAYWLANAHMGNGPGLLETLSRGVPVRNIDPDWIQIYESAPLHGAYFTTSHGLFLQAVQDVLVSDFWGPTEIAHGFPAEWKGAAFGGLRTADGGIWSGRNDGQWSIEREQRPSHSSAE